MSLAYKNISQGTTSASKSQSQGQQSIVADPKRSAGRNNCRSANQCKSGGDVHRPTNHHQQHGDGGDYVEASFLHRGRRRYPAMQADSDDEDNNTTNTLRMKHLGQAALNNFDSPSESRFFRRTGGQYQREQNGGGSNRHFMGIPQPNADDSDDLDAMDDHEANEGYNPRSFQRVSIAAGLPDCQIPIAPTTPAVKGRIVKQPSRRGDPPITGFGDNEDADFEDSKYQDSDMEDDDYYEQNDGSLRDGSADYDSAMDDEEECFEEDQSQSMIQQEPRFRRSSSIKKSRAGESRPSGPRLVNCNARPTGTNRSHPAVARRDTNAGKPRIIFENSSQNLAPSRYSGDVMPWGVNQQPVLVPQHKVSDAHLKKRGLTRAAAGENVGKRSYGANDPENVAIVNMKENDGMSFAQIAEVLNARRVDAGRSPNLTVCGVNGRYNRTAPILFAMQGIKFVPLSDRKKAGGAKLHGTSTKKAGWSADAENKLVDIVKQIDAEKWKRVSQMLNADLYNGRIIHDAAACAKRYAAL